VPVTGILAIIKDILVENIFSVDGIRKLLSCCIIMVTDCVIGHLSMMSLAFKTDQNQGDDLLQKSFNVTFLITYAVFRLFKL